MAEIPAFLLVHALTVEAYLGTSSEGEELFAGPVTLAAFVDRKRRQVRAPSSPTSVGDHVISEATAYLRRGPSIPTGSRVTLPDGSTTWVLAVHDRDGGGLPTPDHLELVLA